MPKSRSPSPTGKTTQADPDIDLKQDKIKITPFSEGKDWESTVFELKLLLRQAWKDTSLDIIKYLTDASYAAQESHSPAAAKANQLIYYILSVGCFRQRIFLKERYHSRPILYSTTAHQRQSRT
jgi:hypothetical protein